MVHRGDTSIMSLYEDSQVATIIAYDSVFFHLFRWIIIIELSCEFSSGYKNVV